MKAVIFDRYGPPEVLKVQDIPTPKPTRGQVLVKIKAFAVNSADARIRGARFPEGFAFLARLAFGLTRPRIKVLGNVFSGIIEAVGDTSGPYKVGDEVAGMTGMQMGAYAEYLAISPLKSMTLKPKDVSHEDAAALLFGGTTALYFLRDKLSLAQGESVLINGASGAVGILAVQLARYFGGRVTAIARQENEGLVRSSGAEDFIDYQRRPLAELTGSYDVVFDTVGNLSIDKAKNLLTPKGRAGLAVASLKETLLASGAIKVGTSSEKGDDMAFLLRLRGEGKLQAVIEKTYTLEEIVEAHKHADSGRKRGNIVVSL